MEASDSQIAAHSDLWDDFIQRVRDARSANRCDVLTARDKVLQELGVKDYAEFEMQKLGFSVKARTCPHNGHSFTVTYPGGDQ